MIVGMSKNRYNNMYVYFYFFLALPVCYLAGYLIQIDALAFIIIVVI